ncbi:kinesin-like protein KIF28P isoform X2 [Ptychodera flava]|uniref:kinesin-like protein KIF28P isoform X2 n=1 Tax=Ptychodera flava TaxID=63121 RepID=UPI00396A38E5
MAAGAENVKVAVRVRPFNDRERNKDARCIVNMVGKSTELFNPDEPKSEPKRFTFDYSYWSHDGFKETEPDRYLKPVNPKYVDQKRVFEDLGLQMLDNAWKGYNCSVFAYGQTGSGKSYSIMGYGANKGVVPMVCDELFRGMNERQKSSEDADFQVTFSMIEIYNEQVRDLLNPKNNPKGGLKIREHQNKGFYVEMLKVVNVNSFSDIESRINEGTRNRTIAATNMNATSSRAHTIVSVTLVQKAKNEAGQSMTKTSIINLVDLAGSERVEKTGATGDRLKEGSLINQSLSTLGNVIKALADVGSGKKGSHVPYRNSALTKLLKNALGGNSKTIMIAAISPADDNYEETLSTLRYADRAKSIKTKAVINESPTEKLIRELREENARLLQQLGGGGGQAAQVVGIPEDEVESMKKMMEEQIQRNKEEMTEMEKSWKQRLAEAESANMEKLMAEQQKQEQMKVIPHIWNLNEDPSLTGMIVHFTPEGVSRVGNKKASPPPEILLNGLSILKEHAVITNKKNVVRIRPCENAKILINGKEVTEEVELHHNDRVMLGSNHLFVFHHPQDLAKNIKAGKQEEKVTYDQAQAEIAENSGFHMEKGPGKSKDDIIFQEDLIEIMPLVSEANAISEELDKKVKFEIALVSPQVKGLKHGRTEVNVLMRNLENGTEFMWNRDKFLNRKYIMQEMYQNFIEGDKDWDVEKEKDPFWEHPDTEALIGYVHVYLQSLAYMIELEETLAITDYKGLEKGHLRVEALPCKKNGKEFSEDEDAFVEEPTEMLGKPMFFKVKIPSARGLPPQFKKSFCRYKFYLDKKMQQTKEIVGTTNPDFYHEQLFNSNPVTRQFLEYIENQPLVIEVWGRQQGKAMKAANLTTKALVAEDTMRRSRISLRGDTSSTSIEPDEKYKLLVELNTHKKRADKMEAKLRKIYDMVVEAKAKGNPNLSADKVEEVLKSGYKEQFKAAAIAASSVNGSKACILQ